MGKRVRKIATAGLVLSAVLGLSGCGEKQNDSMNVIVNPGEGIQEIINDSVSNATKDLQEQLQKLQEEFNAYKNAHPEEDKTQVIYEECLDLLFKGNQELNYNMSAKGEDLLQLVAEVEHKAQKLQDGTELKMDIEEAARTLRERIFYVMPQRAMKNTVENNEYLQMTVSGNILDEKLNGDQYVNLNNSSSCSYANFGKEYTYTENGYAYFVNEAKRHTHSDSHIIYDDTAPLHVDVEDVSETSNMRNYLQEQVKGLLDTIYSVADDKEGGVCLSYENGSYIFHADVENSQIGIVHHIFNVNEDGCLTGYSLIGEGYNQATTTFSASNAATFNDKYNEIFAKVDAVRNLDNAATTEMGQEVMSTLTRVEGEIVKADISNFNFDEVMTQLNSVKVHSFLITDENDQKIVKQKLLDTQRLAVEKQARYSAETIINNEYLGYTNGVDGQVAVSIVGDKLAYSTENDVNLIDGYHNLGLSKNEDGQVNISHWTLDKGVAPTIYEMFVEAQTFKLYNDGNDSNIRIDILYDEGKVTIRQTNLATGETESVISCYDGLTLKDMHYVAEETTDVLLTRMTKEEFETIWNQTKERAGIIMESRIQSSIDYFENQLATPGFTKEDALLELNHIKQEVSSVKDYVLAEQYKELYAKVVDLETKVNGYTFVYENGDEMEIID